MIKFAEDINDDTNDNQEAELQRLEAEKKESKKKFLEISLEQEREELEDLKRKQDKLKEDVKVSAILIGISAVLLLCIFMNATSVVLTFVNNPLFAILILGAIVKFISYIVAHAKKNIPMYIWCENEKKGNNVQHDNLYRQCMEHERKCTNLERELKEIG